MNKVFCGDNLKYMKSLLDEGLAKTIDFIYIDPPFFTESTYKAQVDGEVIDAYSDQWDDLDGYLTMLRERLALMRELLKDSGSIIIHADWHAVHYIKVMADEIFGRKNFINEIIWSYKSGGASKKSFARKHDTLLLYGKTSKYYFNPQKEVSYNRGFKPYRFKGVQEYCDSEGKWYTLVNHKDIISTDMVGRTSKERNGYATQKPMALIKILLESCCPEGGTAADFFGGSGTLAEAAAASGRNFIICDEQVLAIDITKKRLDAIGAEYEYSEE